MSKAAWKAFRKQVRESFAEAGIAVEEDEFADRYRISMAVGEYVCSVSLLWLKTDNKDMRDLDIMGRFLEPAKARTIVDCNPHSGKWNFHGLRHTCTPTDAKDLAVYFVGRILAVRNKEPRKDR